MPDRSSTHIEKTVYRGGTGEITVKKSRFIANVAAVDTKEEAERKSIGMQSITAQPTG